MFIKNKYAMWYYNIIANALTRESIQGYSENHHIVPKSLGGKNNRGNLARLTAKEHFVCHLLLIKMTAGKDKMKMAYAAQRMSTTKNEYTANRYTANSRSYEFIRVTLSEVARLKTPHTPERRLEINRKIKEATTGKKKTIDPETMAQLKLVRSKNATGKKLRPKTEEEKLAHSKKLKGRVSNRKGVTLSAETRMKSSISHLGIKWFHNVETGERVQVLPNEEPPAGFVSGSGKTNKSWFYNEELQESKLFLLVEPIPDGWVLGRRIKNFK
jgi:hypothetical protein